MEHETISIDVSQRPELLAFAREVKRSGRPCLLSGDGEDLARVSPAGRARRGVKGKPTFAGDPFWRIVGMGRSGRSSDASEHVDEILADFELANQA